MRLLTLGLLTLLLGCASFSAGPVAVTSSGMGYEPYYVGGTVRMDAGYKSILVRGEASAFASHKTTSLDEGVGLTSIGLVGYRHPTRVGSIEVLAGAVVGRQTTADWAKNVWHPSAEAVWEMKNGNRFGLRWGGEDNHGEVQSSWTVRTEFKPPSRIWAPSLVLDLGLMDWEQGTKSGTGKRGSIALLWPLDWKRN